MIKIIAVDDNPEYLDSLVRIFKPYQDRYRIVKRISAMKDEYNIEYMLRQLKIYSPDIVLMDLSFSRENQPLDYGIELVKRILAKFPDQKIIMMVSENDESEHSRWEKVRRSFEAGALAFLGKRDTSKWFEAINEVVNGDTYVSKPYLNIIVKGLQEQIEETSPRYKLAKRQLQVLTELAKDQTIPQVANSILGERGKPLSVHTVNFHLRNIRAKLNAKTIHGLIAKAFRESLIR